MNILFIGQVVPDEAVKRCTAYAFSGDTMQKNIILGLKNQKNIDITVVSAYPNASFPKDKIYIKNEKARYFNVLLDNVGYINIPIIKQFSQLKSIYTNAKKYLNKERFDFIICYNMYPQFGGAVLKLEKNMNIPLVSILADLPVEDGSSYSGINRMLFKILKAKTMRNIKMVHHAIVLNENVQKYMNNNNDYIVIPGGISLSDNDFFVSYKEIKRKVVVYAGALSSYSGIDNLIKAVARLENKGIELEIYGEGELKKDIIEISKQSKNVRYMGVRSGKEIKEIMKNAWVLINPRKVDDDVSSVTFPSKLFEYIMCKRPVITTIFNGMPQCIKDITIGCGEGSPLEIEQSINYLCDCDEKKIEKIVNTAYEYVVTNMSWEAQTSKIVDYLEGIQNSEVG